jgi:hypothetical protein
MIAASSWPADARRAADPTACDGRRSPRQPLDLEVRRKMASRRIRPRAAKNRPRRPAKARPGGVTFDQIRRIAADFPGVEVSTSYGTSALKVRGKLFARLHQTEDALVLRIDLLDRQILMQAAPHAFYITDHYLNYPWVLVRLSSVRRDALPDLLRRAWLLVAPRSLAALLERKSQ